MRYRKLDAYGDYTLGGRSHILEGREAVAQAIRTRLLLLLGEWWEDEENGLPLFQSILGSFQDGASLEDVDLAISERILGTENVIELLNFESSLDTTRRIYSASCQVSTAFGTVSVQLGGNQLVTVRA